MANRHKDVLVSPVYYSRMLKMVGVSSLMVLVFLLSACSGNVAQVSLVGATGLDVQTEHTVATTAYPVKVFFSRAPQSLNNAAAVYAVDRGSPTIGVGAFAIQLLIAGPTTAERSAGYFSEFNSLLTGSSICSSPAPVGGPDFTLTLNKRGNVAQTGTVTLRFCRMTASNGVGEDARVTAEIDATLKQFSGIKRVVILTRDGHCFGDESGKDFCLR
jgi:hypothetical protein